MNEEHHEPKDRRGIINGVALALVVIATLYAAFTSSVANSKVDEAQALRDQETACTSEVLFATVEALNSRTVKAAALAKGNVTLVDAQADFLRTTLKMRGGGATNDAARREALVTYIDAIDKFSKISMEVQDARKDTPFPTEEQYRKCRTAVSEE